MIRKTPVDLADAMQATSSGMLEVVTFFAGGHRCAIEARQVRASRPLACENSESYPAIEPLLGLPEQSNACSPRQVLTLRQPEADVELSVATPVELRALGLDAIHPLPDLLAARTSLRGLRALALESDRLILIFDLRDLTGQPDGLI